MTTDESEVWTPELPSPPRAPGVPEDATFDAQRGVWMTGERDAKGARTGVWRSWAMTGALLTEREMVADEPRSAKAFYPDGTVAAHAVHDAARGVTKHTSYFRDGKLWAVVEYTGAIDGLVEDDRVVSEELRAPDGRVLRTKTLERDGEGVVAYRETAGGKPVFENVRTEGAGARFASTRAARST